MKVELSLYGILILFGLIVAVVYYVKNRLAPPRQRTIEEIKEDVVKEKLPKIVKEAETNAQQDISDSDGFVDWFNKRRGPRSG